MTATKTKTKNDNDNDYEVDSNELKASIAEAAGRAKQSFLCARAHKFLHSGSKYTKKCVKVSFVNVHME